MTRATGLAKHRLIPPTAPSGSRPDAAGDAADISGPQGKSEDQPQAKQIAPAEGVTPPAEVHACPTVHSGPCTTRYRCLPTGVTGSRSRPTKADPPRIHPTARRKSLFVGQVSQPGSILGGIFRLVPPLFRTVSRRAQLWLFAPAVHRARA